MAEKKGESGFKLNLNKKTAKKFIKFLNDEGLMRAGFVIHESNNKLELTVKEKMESLDEEKEEKSKK